MFDDFDVLRFLIIWAAFELVLWGLILWRSDTGLRCRLGLHRWEVDKLPKWEDARITEVCRHSKKPHYQLAPRCMVVGGGEGTYLGLAGYPCFKFRGHTPPHTARISTTTAKGREVGKEEVSWG